MPKISNTRILALLLCLTAGVSSLTQAKAINGVGEFTELGQQVFIATLTTENATYEAITLLSDDESTSMNMRVTCARLAQKRFITLWLETFAVNTDSATMLAHTSNLTKFNEMFRGSLQKGDLLKMQYHPDQGFSVVLNGVRLGVISSPSAGAFFRNLLRGWIGEIPMSSKLRSALLSPERINNELLTQFNELSFSSERLFDIENWVQVAAANDVTTMEKNVPSKANIITPSLAIENKFNGSPAPLTVNNKIIPVAKRSENNTNNTTKVIKKSESINNQQIARLKTPTPTPTSIPSVRKSRKPSVEELSELLIEDERTFTIRQQYLSQLIATALKYQTLPRRAFQQRAEGDVRIKVEIDKSGKLISARLAQPSEHKFLDKQAINAVQNAAPYSPIPLELNEQSFVFTVPFRYRLPY